MESLHYFGELGISRLGQSIFRSHEDGDVVVDVGVVEVGSVVVGVDGGRVVGSIVVVGVDGSRVVGGRRRRVGYVEWIAVHPKMTSKISIQPNKTERECMKQKR